MEKQNTKKVIRTGLDMEISGNLCVNKKSMDSVELSERLFFYEMAEIRALENICFFLIPFSLIRP